MGTASTNGNEKIPVNTNILTIKEIIIAFNAQHDILKLIF